MRKSSFRPTHPTNWLAPQQFSQSENEQTARHILLAVPHTHTHEHNTIRYIGAVCVCVFDCGWGQAVCMFTDGTCDIPSCCPIRNANHFLSRRVAERKSALNRFQYHTPTPRPPSKLIVWLRRDPFICFVNFTTQYDDKCIGKVEGES